MAQNKKKLYVTANAHLDTQWNWTIQDTIRDCVKKTLEDNLALIRKYPHYRMNFEGAFRYQLAKEYYPELYAEMKEQVAAGRWNVAGSQWDATDTNVPSSEAYMRQILLGNGFFEAEFGKKSSDIFLSDCFGFRYSLPSIAAHMGLKGFSTQKLIWGIGTPIIHEDGTVTRPMPDKEATRLNLGRWVGPDGNSVVGAFHCGSYDMKFESDPRGIHEREEYARDLEHNAVYSHVDRAMLYYGVGDYGGAPTDDSARYLNEAVEQNGPDKAFQVIPSSTDQIFNEMTPEELEALPVYRGNLHIPHGFGTLTSHAINKRWNRKCELGADAAERAASVAKWLGKGAYPKERLDYAWKLFLWHQFHDDLPGTSVAAAYQFSNNDYVIAQNLFAEELTAALEAVVSTLDTNVSGDPVVVYNPVAFSRADLVTAPLPAGAACARVFTAEGVEVPSQLSTSPVDGSPVVKFLASVAPVSFTVFNVVPTDGACALETDLSVKGNVLENSRYRVTLNAEGELSSVYDKDFDRELLSAPSALATREDNNTVWPAWEIKYEDTKLPFTHVGGTATVELVEQGPAEVAFRITKEENGSTYVQTVSLSAGGQRVTVDNLVDWHNRKTMLSADFPLAVSNPTATFDLGLGAEACGNTDSYPYFQHCVHQWADLTHTDGSFGVAILNDCKYGMEKPTDDTLRLTLIHTPAAPFKYITGQDWQDHGRNLFTYALTSHGPSRDGVAAEAECLNNPLMAFTTPKHEGTGSTLSFLSVNSPEVAVRCVKEEQKGDRLIIRVQETAGRAQSGVTLTLAPTLRAAVETNGYEEGNGAVTHDAHTLTFDLTPFAVKTFALEIENTPVATEAGVPVALPFNKRVTSPRSDRAVGDFGMGISIPEELYDTTVTCGGVTFTLGNPGENNAVAAMGQTLTLPAGTRRAVILAASAKGDMPATFTVGDREITLKISDFSANVGAWDLLPAFDHACIKRDPVAVSYSHTHEPAGDRLYKFANLFKYVVDTEGAETLTLPVCEDVVVMAVTALTGGQDVRPTAPLYDFVRENTAPVHTLTAEGLEGSGEYHEGDLVRLAALRCNENGYFVGFGGDADIIWQEDVQALVRMGDRDATVYPVFSDCGENVVLNKPCRANTYRQEIERPEHAFNGNSENKWAGLANDNGAGWLEVDLGEVTPVYKWLVLHCGEYEDRHDNTVDFTLQYKVAESDEWQIADTVEGNTDDVTLREFTPVSGRYLRLHITKPTPHADRTCRIFQLHVYRYNG